MSHPQLETSCKEVHCDFCNKKWEQKIKKWDNGKEISQHPENCPHCYGKFLFMRACINCYFNNSGYCENKNTIIKYSDSMFKVTNLKLKDVGKVCRFHKINVEILEKYL